ncbi:MAG TPA: POTRA domain-containing protein, partial [Puia sp.]|nr:POTRA domain-containing protein [Puia sp.]
MTKLRLYVCSALLLMGGLHGFSQYRLQVALVDKDSLFNQKSLGLSSSFKDRLACTEYIYQVPGLMQAKGFTTASIDSMYLDSTRAFVRLYLGDIFRIGRISTKKEDALILNASGWSDKKFYGKSLNFRSVQEAQQQILNWLEDNGYPFAKIYLDSISLDHAMFTANLKIERGPLYKIDSIRINGSAKISNDFMQRYLNIQDGSIYRKEKLQVISRRISELPYLQEEHTWTLSLLGTGSVLNLYLKPRKSSQIDVLVGFLPNNDQLSNKKLLVTGEATVNLKNALGNGESIGLNWQQIQVKSPRLNIYFQQPFIFKSPFGLNFSFDLFKKDSSYLNINALLGVQYSTSATKTGTVFIQANSSNLLTVDTLQVIATRKLPAQADLSSVSLGISYEFNNTNYRFNPLRGNEFLFTGTVGTKKIKKSNSIEKLVDPSDSAFSFNSLYDTLKLNSYQFRLKLAAAHYFQLSRASTLRLAVNAAVFQSPNTFRNEVYQIGGYKLLRGFDEESIFASQYAVGTLEYRYLIAQNSFLFGFVDG